MEAGILTLTMHPCVDVTLWQEDWDGPCVGRDVQSGGKGLNAARVLSAMGEDCLAAAPLGGETGRECELLARGEGISLLPVQVKSATRVIVTRALRGTYEQRQAYVSGLPYDREELDRIRAAVLSAMEKRKIFCVCGSAPDETGAALARELLKAAKQRGLLTVLDANGAALTLGAEAMPDILKPNERELCQLLGREIEPEKMFSAAEELTAQGQTVLLTLGGRGAVCAMDGNLYCAPAPKVETVNSVGCGDTFLAAWLHARIRGSDGMDALRFACDAAARSATVFPAAPGGLWRDA